LSFDIAIEELFPALSRGATVVLRGGDETLEPSAFARWVEESRVTVLDLPTAYWHAWVNHLAARNERLPRSLRLVVVGGEKALGSVHSTWRAIGGDRVRWINTYGPTETTVVATAHEPGDSREAEIPIGRPIANVRTYVLDGSLRPVPLGVTGELFIAGAGVGRGYLNSPGLTAERFVADPFSDRPGARMFRTGDLVRWRADGRLEFVGRRDGQIKVSGHRVEIGEVEAAILGRPDVQAAAVAAHRSDSGEVRLDAYFVGPARIDDLRRQLRARLPLAAVPATFTRLDALPLTPTGKLDRRALPAPGAQATAESVSPRDEVEAKLVAIWGEVLGLATVGATDGFFDLGGHSLLAIRLLGRVEEEFGRRLPLATLFQGPTVQDQAELLRVPAADAESHSPLVRLSTRGERPPFFCVHPAGGIVYCFGALARELGDDRPFLAFQSPGLDRDAAA
jgi:aspartate racemase